MKNKYLTKGVTFNLSDPDQNSLLEHACKRDNFSGYIKRLIQKDQENQKENQSENEVTSVDKLTHNTEEFDDNLMSGLL